MDEPDRPKPKPNPAGEPRPEDDEPLPSIPRYNYGALLRALLVMLATGVTLVVLVVGACFASMPNF